MSINSAMYTAVTGLSALGTGMQTISNNIANVSTVGFKAMRTNYEDLISQNYYSGGKANQRGCGVKVSTIQSMFTQGAFMSSAQDTDMAIAGDGFFQVRNPVDGGTYYTRAGVFTLTKDGQMEDPSGNILQGWQMSIPKPGKESTKIGALTDVKITVMNAPPVATSTIKAVNNLDARDKPAYIYRENEMTHDYADRMAVADAEIDRDIAINATYTSADGIAKADPALPSENKAALSGAGVIKDIDWPATLLTGGAGYQQEFLDAFNALNNPARTDPPLTMGDLANLQVVTDGRNITVNARSNGYMTESEFEQINAAAFAAAGGNSTANSADITWSASSAYNSAFLDEFNRRYNNPAPPANPVTDWDDLKMVSNGNIGGTALTQAQREAGLMTEGEFESIKLVAKSAALAEAEAAGREAYDKTYRTVYDNTREVIEANLTNWQLEGNGFAGAWNAQETPYIDQENYTHVEPMDIYDSLGNKHKLMVYYQKNPHMENVWD
ncbi:MAG: flagellar hook-basal body complex protein, partial [Candidatus Adiutrix sp.]|nr:flagellar hook-basal body complex protein [Candidatus Adiutrix sp.]